MCSNPTYSYDAEESDFDLKMLQRSHEAPMRLDIGADWYAPCRVLTPRMEELAHEYKGEFLLTKVDADENMRIAARHGVRSFPMVICLQPRGGNQSFTAHTLTGFCANSD